MGVSEKERAVLESLDSLVRRSEIRAALDVIAARVERRLEADQSSLLAWEPIPLSLYGETVPRGIRSSWVFVLRASTV